jgi:hypothetical protein
MRLEIEASGSPKQAYDLGELCLLLQEPDPQRALNIIHLLPRHLYLE